MNEKITFSREVSYEYFGGHTVALEISKSLKERGEEGRIWKVAKERIFIQ